MCSSDLLLFVTPDHQRIPHPGRTAATHTKDSNFPHANDGSRLRASVLSPEIRASGVSDRLHVARGGLTLPRYLDLKQFPPRPRRFTVQRLRGIKGFAGDDWAERVFGEQGRGFYIFIWIRANDRHQLPTLLAALDSLHITRTE